MCRLFSAPLGNTWTKATAISVVCAVREAHMQLDHRDRVGECDVA